jgi:hypothetical protein
MKKLFQENFLWLVPLALVMAGCNRQTALVPPQIHYGLETCADCKMIINDAHYAAALAWRAHPGSPSQISSFDDIGCLLSWRQHHPEVQVAATWVKGVNTAQWLDATSVVYLKNDQLATPMGSGIVAGATDSDFSALSVHGPVLNWSNVLKAGKLKTGSLAEAVREPMNH